MWTSDFSATRVPLLTEGGRQPPSMCVIVTSTGPVEALRLCLEGIGACCLDAGVEVVVVRAGPAAELEKIAAEWPSASYLAAAPETSSVDLRRTGLLQSTRNVVAFVDDQAPERQVWTAELCRSWRAWMERGGRMGAAEAGGVATRGPRLSVVIPVRNGGPDLLRSLEALALSDLPHDEWELVVVDDASTDDTSLIAAQYADRLVRLPGAPHGPGYARNRGFEATLGECITFLNADVMVRPDTLRQSAAALLAYADVGAVFGAYDTKPIDHGFVSQYRNLLQHYVHRRHVGEAFTFSSACGTLRSRVFEQAGGYDEWHFGRHQLEDLELGQRIRQLGHRILLHPDIGATHLKRWTLAKLVRTEIFDRGVPWMRLFDRQVSRRPGRGRSLRGIRRMNTLLTWTAVEAAIIAACVPSRLALAAAAGCVAWTLVNDRAQLAFFRRERGLAFAAATVLLDLVYYLAHGIGIALGWIMLQLVGEPRPGATAEAFEEMSIDRWPPVPVRRALDWRLDQVTEADGREVAGAPSMPRVVRDGARLPQRPATDHP